jgi:predicted PurR-regulated permease PerM
MIWGITGMIISVPLLVVTQIILEHFTATKPLATMMLASARGHRAKMAV